jgi:hypothetical protein
MLLYGISQSRSSTIIKCRPLLLVMLGCRMGPTKQVLWFLIDTEGKGGCQGCFQKDGKLLFCLYMLLYGISQSRSSTIIKCRPLLSNVVHYYGDVRL